MRRGRLFIYIAAILIIGMGLVYWYFQSRGDLSSQGSSDLARIVVAGRDIPRGKLLTLEDLNQIDIPSDQVMAGSFTDFSLVVGRFSKYPLDQGVILMDSFLGLEADNLGEAGSSWAYRISPGMTAVTIPISKLSSVGYGISDGDHINMIASMLIVDVDANFQSITPNTTAGLLASGSGAFFVGEGSVDSQGPGEFQMPAGDNLTAQSVSGQYLSPQGRVELDPNFQEPFYIVPSEKQRPRLVSQMVLQNILVLHIGDFLAPVEVNTSSTAASDSTAATTAVAEATPAYPESSHW